MNRGRSIAFYIESIAVVLLLLAVLAVAVQFLGKARVESVQAQRITASSMAAQDVAETFIAHPSGQELAKELGGSWLAASQTVRASTVFENDVFNIRVKLHLKSIGSQSLLVADIDVYQPDSPDAYSLSVTSYQGGGGQ